MANHHPYHLRHGNRLLNHLFSDENNGVNDSIMTVTANTTSTSMLFENSTTSSSSMLLLVEHNLPPESSPAPWSTRKTILLAEAIVVTAIVLPLLFCFLYQRASKSGHLPARSRSRQRQQLHHGVSNTNAAAEVARTSDRALRSIILQQQQEEYEPQQQVEDHHPPRSLIQRLTSILLYPFHAIDAGVHSWSTTNADITFLRNVMDRLEEERVAQLEDVEERGERLKLAFSEGDSVWVS